MSDDDTPISEPASPEVPTGPDVIEAFVKNLPGSPGVYRMLDENGAPLYVGKARNLKNRVTNYTKFTGNSNRIARMISLTATMEFVTTNTETEALLLESNLIKRLKPRFNVLLRDDKSFPYLLIARDHEAPELAKHRGARKRKGDYFGPFASAGAVNRTLTALQKAFLLRNCSDSYYENRTRPCLQFQIKRCSAPCTGQISIANYNLMVDDAAAFLTGKSNLIQANLAKEMETASENLDFERAAILRDRLSALAHVQSRQDINPQKTQDADVFAVYQDAGQTCIQVFFFRNHQNWGNHAYYPRADKSLSESEVLEPFLGQFYENRIAPKLVLLSAKIDQADLLSQALSNRADRKVEISTPQRGERKDLVDHAHTNARQALGRRLSETATQSQLLAGVAETFGLPETPRRIETYDNSHIQGTNAVGGMIVAGAEGFSKKHYRTFNIKSTEITPGDDFGMMREVLTRRFSRLLKEVGPRENEEVPEGELPQWPDLLLIDGGKGQITATKQVMVELGLDGQIPLVGIAKGEERNSGRETFIVQGREPFMLPARDPVLYYVQRLRDEAHRFAIGTHRARRKKNFTKSPLDEIAGIGPNRKRALLNNFGSAKAIGKAALADLQAVDGISKLMAQQIYDHFQQG